MIQCVVVKEIFSINMLEMQQVLHWIEMICLIFMEALKN